MIFRLFTYLICSIGLVHASVIEAPEVFMQRVTATVLEEIHKIPADDLPQIYALVDKELLPLIDLPYMSRWVAGRRAWGAATDSQKEVFVETFQKLMIKTYSSTLFLFKDRAMTYSRPPRVDYVKAKTIPVFCEIEQPGKESIQVIYQLRMYTPNWKIFDVLIEGVSMLKGLQSQYEQIIAQKGIEGGIEAMQKKLDCDSNNAR